MHRFARLLPALALSCGPGLPSGNALITAHNTAVATATAVEMGSPKLSTVLAEQWASCPAPDDETRSALLTVLGRVGKPMAETLPPVATACAALGPAKTPWLGGLSDTGCAWLQACRPLAKLVMPGSAHDARAALSPLSHHTTTLVGGPTTSTSSSSGALAQKLEGIGLAALIVAGVEGGPRGVAARALSLQRFAREQRHRAGPDQLEAALDLERLALTRISALLVRGAVGGVQARALLNDLHPAGEHVDQWQSLARISFVENNRQLSVTDTALRDQLQPLPGAAPNPLPAPDAGNAWPTRAWMVDQWLPAWRPLLDAPDLPYGARRALYIAAWDRLQKGGSLPHGGAQLARLAPLDLAAQATDAATCSLRLGLHLAQLPPDARRVDTTTETIVEVLGPGCGRDPVLGGPWTVQDTGDGIAIEAASTDLNRAARLGLKDDLRGMIGLRLRDELLVQ